MVEEIPKTPCETPQATVLTESTFRLFEGLLRPDRIGCSLDEGLDFHDVIIIQLPGEVRHSLRNEWPVEHNVLQVGDGLS